MSTFFLFSSTDWPTSTASLNEAFTRVVEDDYVANIVYVLGRAGSGKSTVAQIIEQMAQQVEWRTEHLFDYSFLDKRFQQEIASNIPDGQRCFKQPDTATHQGFDVVKFEVLDYVLQDMANYILEKKKEASSDQHTFIVEFARQAYGKAYDKAYGKAYGKALDIFNQKGLLQGSTLLYINLGVEKCIQRIHERIAKPQPSRYDHFISDEIMHTYYSTDDWDSEEMKQYLGYLERHSIRITTKQINNDGSLSALNEQVDRFLKPTFRSLVPTFSEYRNLPVKR